MPRQTSGRKQTSFIFSPPVLVVFVALLLTGTYVYLTKNKPSADTSSTVSAPTQTKTFRSETMEFEIEVPEGFEVEDLTSAVDLNSNKGKISIVRNGTNFKDLNSYLQDFDSKRKVSASSVINLKIDTFKAVSRILNISGSNTEQKSYYIYINNGVYVISTDSSNLYPTLDQIAQSFRYIPK